MLTVLMATHNGASTLPRVLRAYTHLAVPSDGWKIVIVDNASVDQTQTIIKEFTKKLPISYLQEHRRGKNIALNRGLQHIEGDLVVLTDDDAIPEPDWLEHLSAGAHDNTDFAVFGGGIRPVWEQQPAQWILDSVPLGPSFALTDPDVPEGPIFPGLVWGPNMAVRTEVFENGFRFDEAVGPAAGRYIMGSETEFTIRVFENGYKSWFCRKAIVNHIIRGRQLRSEWLLDRAYKYGRCMYCFQQARTAGLNGPKLLGVPHWMFGKYLKELRRVPLAQFRGQKVEAFKARWELSYLRGFFYQAFVSRRDTN
jgi:glycosyltransferase involved in cell wall biosynthesis